MPAPSLVMLIRRTRLVAPIATSVALATVLAAQPAIALSAPAQGDFEQLLADADGHAIEGRHAQALTEYEQAFAAMPAELRATSVGELVVVAASKSALEDFKARGDIESLKRGRALLVDFIVVVSSHASSSPPSLDTARKQLAEIDDATPAPEPAAAAEPEPEPEPEPETEPEPEPEPPAVEAESTEPVDDRSMHERDRKLGLGLAIGGGAVTLGGLALIIAGTQQVPWFQQRMEEIGWTPDHPDYDTEAARAIRTRNIDIGVGAGLAVVGLSASVAGAVLLARGKRDRDDRVSLGGAVDRRGAMLSARLRF